MSEFQIGDFKYRTRPMDGRRQFHVARRLVGVVGAVGGDGDPLQAIASMPDTDADYVIDSCLAVTERQDPATQSWAPVMGPNGYVMFDDLRVNLAAMLQIVGPVIMENVAGFLAAFPKELSDKLTAMMEKKSA